MPIRQLRPYIEALPHVRAVASVSQAEAIAVGTGSMRQSDRAEATTRWSRDIRRPTARTSSPAELAAAAKASGLGFRRVPARKPAEAVTDVAAAGAPPAP